MTDLGVDFRALLRQTGARKERWHQLQFIIHCSFSGLAQKVTLQL